MKYQERLEAPDRTFVGHRDILTRSLARYHFIAPHVKGVALEIGCGRGYGFEVIAREDTRPVGIDVSWQFLRDARRRFVPIPLANATGDILPFASRSFDSIISLDVIEHIEDDKGFLAEIRRVARDNAFIALSTPNRLATSGHASTPLNRFHVREYCLDELLSLLNERFSSVDVFGQREGKEGAHSGKPLARLIDRIPISWKYLLPTYIQDLLSVTLRPPLRLNDVRFEREKLRTAHTFVALCRC